MEGDEGFLIGFNVADEGDRCWWNIGGWSNTKTQLEERISYVNNPVGNESSLTVENGRTYHITIAVNNDNVKCYLDGEQIHDYNFTVLEGILHHAFEGCSNLSSITIPNTVTSIGERAFYGCSSLPSITIPNTITSIGLSAFENCWGLANVEIPNSVTSIGAYVFKGCAGLTSVNIPNSITSISEQAFYGCSALTNIEIPNSVTSIGQYAFHSCSSLTELVIPSSVSSIGWGAFEQTPQLASIVVDDANTTFDSRDNCNAIIETATNTLVAACKNTVIPNTITAIGGAAFTGCTGLNSVIIPENVTSIGSWAFNECSGLTSLTIPKSVTSIGENSFSGCNNLTEIHWTPNADTNLSSSLSSANLTSTDRTLYLYKNAENATMVDQLVISLDGQFKEIIEYYVLDLTQADYHNWTAPDATGEIVGNGYCVYEVGNSAGNIYGNPNVTACDYADLSDCGGLIVIASAGTPRFLFNRPTDDSQDYIIIPNNAEQTAKYQTTVDNGDGTISYIINVPAIVADYGFCHLHAIKGANWQDATIESIEVSRKNINFADANVKALCIANWDTSHDGELSFNEAAAVTSLGTVFKGNTEITSFDELQYFTGLTEIGDNSFDFCTALTSVIIPSTVTTIGVDAFSHCPMTTVTIPESVEIMLSAIVAS